jgi:hypothetical protein
MLLGAYTPMGRVLAAAVARAAARLIEPHKIEIGFLPAEHQRSAISDRRLVAGDPLSRFVPHRGLLPLHPCNCSKCRLRRGGKGTLAPGPAPGRNPDPACAPTPTGTPAPARMTPAPAPTPPSASPSNRVECLNLTLGIGTAMALVSMKFGPQNCGAVPGPLPRTRCGEDGRRLLQFSNGF